MTAVTALGFSACGGNDTIYVLTNAYFAPFEYFDGTDIKGVDVDIMNMVGEKLGKKVVIEHTDDFGIIIDSVSSGKKHDCGAAGITITEERKEKVAFSNPYYTSTQYVVFKTNELTSSGTDGAVSYVTWESLSGLKIGTQLDTTGDFFVADEIDAGALKDTNASEVQYADAPLAISAIESGAIDVLVIDELPAKYYVSKNQGLSYLALYYAATEDEPAQPASEEYAICVTKGNDELLKAINEVLADLGKDGIANLVSMHFGLD